MTLHNIVFRAKLDIYIFYFDITEREITKSIAKY